MTSTLRRAERGYIYGSTVDLVIVECYLCAVPFGMPNSLDDECHKDHTRSFYCPNGHDQHYLGETEAQKLKRQLKWVEDSAARVRADLDRAEASRRAWKGQATKARNRLVSGTCPICGKYLADLDLHVTRKHPDEHVREMTEADLA